MPKRLMVLALLALIAVGAFWLSSYSITPAGTIEKASSSRLSLNPYSAVSVGATERAPGDFEVVLSADYPGGRALLVQRGPDAELWLTRHWGPVWRAVNMTAVPAPDATHRLSSAGLGSKWNSDSGDPTIAAAFAGFVGDPRVTVVEAGGETVKVAATHAYLFARLTNDIYFFRPSRAMAEGGTPLYHITERSLMDWVPATP